MRDILYEQEIKKHCQTVIAFLDEYSNSDPDSWTLKDSYAIERALQILIESCIGIARYFVQTKYNLNVSKSREAFDVLRKEGDLDYKIFEKMMKIVGFRNILVHDYLDLELDIVISVVKSKEYEFLSDVTNKLLQVLEKIES